VDKAIEQLVWAHSKGSLEARKVATEYFARNDRRILVATIFSVICALYMSNRFLIDKCLEDGHTKCFLLFLRMHSSLFNLSYCLEQREARETWRAAAAVACRRKCGAFRGCA
jgi:hypothetical protein